MNPYIRFYLLAVAALLPVAVLASLLTDIRLLAFLGPYVVLMVAACVSVVAVWEQRIEPWLVAKAWVPADAGARIPR